VKKRVSKTLYEKKGGRFVPVGKDDIVLPYGFGDYIVRVRRSGSNVHWCKRKVTADYAKLEALMAEATDAIASAIVQHSETEPKTRPNTEREQRAWESYKSIAGVESLTLSRRSAQAVAMGAVLVLGRRIRDKACPSGCAEVFADREERCAGAW
jgi:hypothetical protein